MLKDTKQEVWLRGPLPEIADLLQPIAHALLQAQEEIHEQLADFPQSMLWERPAGLASVGFHLQHITGVLDRLFAYARQESLSENQLHYLQNEANPEFTDGQAATLLESMDRQILIALKQLKYTNTATLTEVRYVGRAMVPSTHLGLLFHAAEHTQRHTGQLLVTARILSASR